MNNITIKEYGNYIESQVLGLYRSVGWSAYYHQPEVLKRAFENSLYILGAYDGGELVGLLRAVGDGETIVFLQDILVRPDHQRRGIGRGLIARFFQEYQHVRQLHLLTDDTPATVGFYRSVGFIPAEELHCKTFTRLRY